MVAAAKLRRAQDAAQKRAPLCRAHGRGDRQPGRRRSPGPARRRCWSAPGSDQRHLVVVATADRGLAGGFNSGIVRAAREKIASADRRGQGRPDHHHRPQGAATSCAALYGDRYRRQLRGRHQARASRWRQPIADQILEPVRGRRSRRRHPVLQPLQVGGHARPRPRAQLIPAQVAERRRIDLKGACLRI